MAFHRDAAAVKETDNFLKTAVAEIHDLNAQLRVFIRHAERALHESAALPEEERRRCRIAGRAIRRLNEVYTHHIGLAARHTPGE